MDWTSLDLMRCPDFQRLRQWVLDGGIAAVWVLDRDRLQAQGLQRLIFLSECQEHNVQVITVQGPPMLEGAEGQLVELALAIGKEKSVLRAQQGAKGGIRDRVSTHVKKGIGERARKGLHLGGIPFCYASCKGASQQGRGPCEEEHPGSVHIVQQEAEAIRELFRRYATGTVTLSQLASWLNREGFRTRNMHRLQGASGDRAGGPRLFTVASVRGILHNPFYMGKLKHRDQLLPGSHGAVVSEDLFHVVQATLQRNSGRSETLGPHPEREYLLKGLIRCAYCMMPMWAQTFQNGHRYYREQFGSRGEGYCVRRSGSIGCHVPDDQMGRIVSAITLPEAWLDRLLAQVHLEDEVKKVEQERIQTQQRLQRLSKVYLDGNCTEEDYEREKRVLQEKLGSLVVPGVDATREAGRLLEDLPRLWENVDTWGRDASSC